MNKHLQLVAPCNENRQVEPGLRRLANAEMRSREYLLPAEIEKLIRAAKEGRWGHRDATLIMVGYRHGLRAVELAGLQWDQVEFGRSARLHVRRAKGGTPSVHPIQGDELRMLTALRREYPESGYVFTTERSTPFTPDAINRLIKTSASARSSRCLFIAICCDTARATPWQIAGSTLEQFKLGWGMSQSRTPPDTRR